MLKRKILVCTNLIGDSLYLLGPVKKLLEKNREDVAAILVEQGLAGEMFLKCFGLMVDILFFEDEAKRKYPDAEFLYLSAGQAADICYANARKTGKQLHISEGYARLLGVDLEGDIIPPTDWQYYNFATIPDIYPFEHQYALISPFSRSCSRHTGERPNKTLDDWKWEPIIRHLRRHDHTVKVIGSPKDRLENCSVLESDYISATSLENLEVILRRASIFITLDNGLCHVASSLGIKTIVFWPQVSNIEFIAPAWSPNTALVQMGDPNIVAPFQLLHGVKKMSAWFDSRKDHV